MAHEADQPLRMEKTPTLPQYQDTTPLQLAKDKDEERDLNAAVAREISRELDALQFDPPTPVPLTQLPDPGPEPSPSTVASSTRPGPHSPLDASTRRPSSMDSSAQSHIPVSTSPSHVSSSYVAPQSPSSPDGPGSPIAPPSPKYSTPLPVLPPINVSGPEIQIPPVGPTSPAFRPSAESLSSGSTLITTGFNKSTPSLPSSPSPSGTSGTRTIAAAAFKRPQGRVISGPGALGGPGLDAGGVQGLSMIRKPTLPSSPYPPRLRDPLGESGPSPGPRVDDVGVQRVQSDSYARYRVQPQPQQPPPTYGNVGPPSGYSQQQQQLPPLPAAPYGDVEAATTSEEGQYDYISAFMNSTPSVESGSSDHGGHPAGSQGYGPGRSATDLEGGLR